MPEKEKCIRIEKSGPYIVTGNIPLSEKIIVPKGGGHEYAEGRPLPQAETYALCRCGKSKNPPFCDGSHTDHGFIGAETAGFSTYDQRAEFIEGVSVDLLDDHRCAYARFCHNDKGSTWALVRNSHTKENEKEAIRTASECPTGRLTAVDKDGNRYENACEPSIEVLQDPEMGVSGGLFVKGFVRIISSDGRVYESRNRVVLCRCGRSKTMPFCDASHVPTKFSDKR